MTYCAGWKYRNTVYLIADAAATKNVASESLQTSFGELQGRVRDDYVEECLLKIIPIGGGTVVAFSGDVQLATECIDFLKDNRRNCSSNSDALQLLSTSLGPFERKRAVALLLAASNETGESELLQWSTVDCKVQIGADFYEIGSLTSYHRSLTPFYLSHLTRDNIDPERLLPVVTAFVQSYGTTHNMIEMNVGGLIFGIKTANGVSEWQSDTHFFVYDPDNLDQISFVTAMARENTVLVHSSFSKDVRVFAHQTSGPSSFTRSWVKEMHAQLDSGSAQYWVFISTRARLLTILFKGDPPLDRLAKFTRLSKGRFDLAFSEQMLNILQMPLIDPNDGTDPMRVNVQND